MTDLDSELARRFADLARSDEEAAPSFRTVLGRRTPVRRSLVRPFLAAAAVAVAISIGASLLWISRAARVPSTPAIADWRSPTSSLLQTPGRELLESAPDLGAPDLAPPAGPVTTKSTPLPKGASS
jgi:hypothetical protein